MERKKRKKKQKTKNKKEYKLPRRRLVENP